MKAFFYHVVFLGILGPLTPILIYALERDLILTANMAFLPTRITLLTYMIQVILWACTVVPIIFLLTGLDDGLLGAQKNGFDFFLLVTAVLQLLIRAAIIAAKYATFPEKLWTKIHQTVLTKYELEAEHLATSDG